MDRIFLLLHYHHGYILLQYVERQCPSILTSLAGYSTCIVVSCFPDVVHLNLLRQRIDLSSIGCVRSSIPAQPNRTGGSRSPSLDGVERVEKSYLEFSGMSKSFRRPSDRFLISSSSRSVALLHMLSCSGVHMRSTRLSSHIPGNSPMCITK